MIKSTAIIVAAGSGSRMNSDIKKQYIMLENMPVLAHTLKAFDKSIVDEIILVVGRGEEEYAERNIVQSYQIEKVAAITAGGKARYNSVYEGLKKANGDIVLVHDGARPFVSLETIRQAADAADSFGACVVACEAVDTVKIESDGFVEDTPPRKHLWYAQTPQAFKRQVLKEAYDKMFESDDYEGITDDAMVVERFSDRKVKIVPGDYNNTKITTPKDLAIAKYIMNEARGA